MIKISADSTCDLSKDLIEKYGVHIAPLYIVKDDQSLKDGLEITPADIFKYVEETGKLTKTAAVSMQDYIDHFTALTKDGSEVIHINISSEFSSCYQNAAFAAKEVPGVYTVDSRNLSTGSGLLVIEAALMAKQGVPAEEIQKKCSEMTAQVEASFVLEHLTYLHKGGRCSTIAALGANMLHLKPCIEVREGKMSVGKKYRGSFSKVLGEYVADRLKGRTDILSDRIFLTHSACTPEMVATVREAIQKNFDFGEILETTAGCTISTHCGPHTLGILFLRKPQ